MSRGGAGGRLFLETTIQLERFWDTRERRAEIRGNLRGKELCTSSYVQMEFQRTFLKDLAYVRSVVASDCGTDADGKIFLSELLRKLSRRRGGRGKRSVERSFMVVSLILDQFPETRVSRTEVLDFLSYQIDSYQEAFFEADLTLEGNGIVRIACTDRTDCDLVKDHLAADDPKRFRCRRSEAACSLPLFLERHHGLLKKVRAAFSAETETQDPAGSDSRMTEGVRRVLDPLPIDWNRAKGQKNCWPLGDTIIALESPEDAALYTTDRHFEVICPIVRRKKYREQKAQATDLPARSL